MYIFINCQRQSLVSDGVVIFGDHQDTIELSFCSHVFWYFFYGVMFSDVLGFQLLSGVAGIRHYRDCSR